MAIKYLDAKRIRGSSTGADKKILKFTGNGTFTPTEAFSVEYLVIGGGAGAAVANGGGGGAGAYRTASITTAVEAYTITVGAGSAGATDGNFPTNGAASSLNSSSLSIVTSDGGAAAGRGGQNAPSYSGNGSGGGAGNGSSGSDGGAYGNNGGDGTANDNAAGGGGSAGNGADGATNGGAGGIGTASSITGSSLYYSGGGGGAAQSGSGGAGGSSVGGAGSSSGSGNNAVANTGSGGGGGTSGTGGNGSAGVVILSFDASKTGYSTTGTVATTTTTQDEKTTVTDVPDGSEFEQTDNYKTYQRGASTIEWKNGIPNSQGSKFTIAGTKITNTSTGWGDGYAIGTLGDTASNGITITDLQSSSTSNMIGLTWLDSSNVPRGETPNSYDSLSYSFQFQDSPDVVNIQVDGVNANGYSALAWETSDKLKMVMTSTDVKFYMDTGSGYSLIHTCDSTSGSGSSSEVPDSSKTYYMLGLIYTTSEWLIGDSGVKNQWVERGTAI